jgi:hypothetical protein
VPSEHGWDEIDRIATDHKDDLLSIERMTRQWAGQESLMRFQELAA